MRKIDEFRKKIENTVAGAGQEADWCQRLRREKGLCFQIQGDMDEWLRTVEYCLRYPGGLLEPGAVQSCMNPGLVYLYPLEFLISDKPEAALRVKCGTKELIFWEDELDQLSLDKFCWDLPGAKGCIPCRNCGGCSW